MLITLVIKSMTPLFDVWLLSLYKHNPSLFTICSRFGKSVKTFSHLSLVGSLNYVQKASLHFLNTIKKTKTKNKLVFYFLSFLKPFLAILNQVWVKLLSLKNNKHFLYPLVCVCVHMWSLIMIPELNIKPRTIIILQL